MRSIMDAYDPERFPPAARTCPRCGRPATLRFAGPCETCTDELRATIRGEAVQIDAEYEPKRNVTPNAVALRDD
jgi:hypothetical protein